MDAIFQFCGRLHPMVLHAPIGLLIGLAVLESLAIVRKFEVPRPVRATLMWLTALSAASSAATGLVLDREGTFGAASTVHQWFGLGLAATCLLAAVIQQTRRIMLYRVVLLGAALVSVPTGHFGASLTHGETFLTEPFSPKKVLPKASDKPVLEATATSEYLVVVAPIFKERCIGCHGAEKSKGKLRLDSPEWIAAGGENGPVLVAGKPDQSEIIIRAGSPLDDDDHMPPKSKPQLTKDEVAALKAWIQRGASFSEPAPGIPVAKPLGATPAGSDSASGPAAADPVALAALADALIHVQPHAAGGNLLDVDCAAVAATLDDEKVRRLLTPIRLQIVDLSLARTKITDASVTLLAGMPAMRRLNLSSTAISDAGIAGIAGLPGIEELVIAQTQVSDIEGLKVMAGLKRLYCWGAKLSAEKISALAAARPGLEINAGEVAQKDALEIEPPPVFTAPAASAKPQVAAAASLAPINTICPVSGKPIDPTKLVVYKGKVVGMCCEHCAEAFLADPEKYASKLDK